MITEAFTYDLSVVGRRFFYANPRFRTFENGNSGHPKMGIQDIRKSESINNEYIKKDKDRMKN